MKHCETYVKNGSVDRSIYPPGEMKFSITFQDLEPALCIALCSQKGDLSRVIFNAKDIGNLKKGTDFEVRIFTGDDHVVTLCEWNEYYRKFLEENPEMQESVQKFMNDVKKYWTDSNSESK
jgi:hypothetical protein